MPDQDLRKRFPGAMLILDDEQLRIIEKFGTLKSFKGGQSLVEAGAPGPNFYVICFGEGGAGGVSPGEPPIILTARAGEVLGGVTVLFGRASNLARACKRAV